MKKKKKKKPKLIYQIFQPGLLSYAYMHTCAHKHSPEFKQGTDF